MIQASRSLVLHRRLASALEAGRAPDGGFGPHAKAPSEPEPTALAALALDDAPSRDWLAAHQRSDGAIELTIGPVVNDSSTALAALALPAGPARERALDHVVRAQAARLPANASVPLDPNLTGWGWTRGTAAWVEPTARALLALRTRRPSATDAIGEALAVLEDRECVGGGWNYGNRLVLGEDLPPFGQTTAVALVALQGAPADLGQRAAAALRRLWPKERGALTLATALAAFRLIGDPEGQRIELALDRLFEDTGFVDDQVALAWATLATGRGLLELQWGGQAT